MVAVDSLALLRSEVVVVTAVGDVELRGLSLVVVIGGVYEQNKNFILQEKIK